MEQQTQQNEKLVRIKFAADFLGVHPQTLRRWEEKKIIKTYHFGKSKTRYFKISELKKQLKI